MIETVYWVVGWRWVIHYGEPAKVVNVRGLREKEVRESWEKCFIFTDNSHACRVADLFQSNKDKLTIQFHNARV